MILDYGQFWQAIGFLCMNYECSVTSGYRTVKRNNLVKGSPHSRHLEGLAADLVPDDMSPENIGVIVQAAERIGVAALPEPDHIHVQVSRRVVA